MTVASHHGFAVPAKEASALFPSLVVAGGTAVALALHASMPLNHDVAWIMEGAQRLLAGGQFGHEVVDANPPLAWWLSCIPAAFAQATGIRLALSSVLFTLAAGLASISLTNGALRKSRLPSPLRNLLIAFLPIPLLILPGYDFGQREHLMLIGAVPYLAAACLAAEDRRLSFGLSLSIGVFAATMFCLKPYFLLVPIFAEGWLAVRRHSMTAWLRPEFLVIPVLGVLYVIAIRLFAPDYLAVVMPEAMAIYWAFNSPPMPILFVTLRVMAPALSGWLLILIAQKAKPSLLAQIFAVGALGASAGCLLQMKGFSYHLVPGAALAVLACAADSISSGPSRKAFRIALFLAVATVTAITFNRQMGEGTAARVDALSTVFQKYAGPGGTVYAFITSPRDIHPAIVASNTRWASTACCLYHLPAAVRADERPQAERARILSVAESQTNRAIGDLLRTRPAVIVIDANEGKLGIDRPFDYLAYLSRFPSFVTLWRSYTELESIGGFRIFVRKPQS
jgi:hypothetical protein